MFELTCIDVYGNVITHLTQWDINQTLIIKNSGLNVAPEFHFENTKVKNAYPVASSIDESGNISVDIPNILLQHAETIYVHIYVYSDEDSAKTVKTFRIPVRQRKKPDDYEYIENVEYISISKKINNGLKYYGDAGVIPSPVEWFTFDVNTTNNTATITGFSDVWVNLEDNSKYDIIIPYEIDGYRVTEIGESAFTSIPIKSVILPNTIEWVGFISFSGTDLTSIIMPDNLDMKGMASFESCKSLTNVKLPNNITSIESWTFDDCPSLTSITIPDGVTAIYANAFSKCTSLTSIKIPDSVINIDATAFEESDNLTIICSKGSYAESYAKENGFPYVYDLMYPSEYLANLELVDDHILSVTKGDGSTTDITLFSGESGTSIIVDDALNSESENPVQNKVIATGIDVMTTNIGMLRATVLYNVTAAPQLEMDEQGNPQGTGLYYLCTEKKTGVETLADSITGEDVLFASPTYVDNKIGEIETALDNIIAIQNTLIGGETV